MKALVDFNNSPPVPENAKINDFAIRCFRDTGDGDYIAARLAMRSHLAANFLWAAQQAIEKYLKCILMLNRQNTGDLGHDIGKALLRINSKLPFTIVLNKPEQELFDHLSQWGGDRYLIVSFHVFDKELLKLDLLVWKLRQYCVPLDLDHYYDTPDVDVLLRKVKAIESRLLGPAADGHVKGGTLEKVLQDRKNSARPGLVWKNARYSGKAIKTIRFVNNFQAVNAPLYISPHLADAVAPYMRIPKDILAGARELAAQNKVSREKAP